MIGVRWLPSPLALPNIAFSFLDLYNAYEISQLSLRPNHMNLFKPYSL